MNGIDQLLSYNVYQGLINAHSPSSDNYFLTLSDLAGEGTVTSFSSGNLSPLFTTSVATATTTPALSFTLSNQNANLVFAGPSSGGASAPTFRALVASDIPSLSSVYVPYTGATTTVDLNNQILTDIVQLGVGVISVPNFITATGIQPASVATSLGTSSNTTGAIVFTAAKGGNTTIATTGVGGLGGPISITSGSGGTATSATTSSTAGGSGSISFTAAAGIVNSTVTSTLTQAGAGGQFAAITGNGGAASLSTGTNTGGAAGAISFIGGNGGAAGTASPGSGGVTATAGLGASVNFTAGNGGAAKHASATSTGGNGGGFAFSSGSGGLAQNATTTNGGNAGNFTFTAGLGGFGTTTTGLNGTISFNVDGVTGLVIGNNSTGLVAVSAPFQYTGTAPTNGYFLQTDGSGNATWAAGNAGTVTSVSVVTDQGVSGSVANSTTTPAITLTLGDLTGVTSFNGLIITANTGVITTGTWNGSLVTGTYGGTGVNNGSFLITVAGNLTTTGAFNTTFAASATATYTLPTASSTLLANSLGLSGNTTLIGGTTSSGTLTLESTSGAGSTDSILFKTGSQVTVANFNTSGYLFLGGSTSATGYLQLAAGTTSVAPMVLTSGTNRTTATAGNLEYDGTFVNFTNSGAVRQTLMQVQMTYVSSNFTSSAGTTTPANITGLTATLVSGKSYVFEIVLFISADGTGGQAFAMAGTAPTGTVDIDFWDQDLAAGAVTNTSKGIRVTAFNGGTQQLAVVSSSHLTFQMTIRGSIINAGATGAMTPQFSNGAAGGSGSVVLAGSYMKVIQVA